MIEVALMMGADPKKIEPYAGALRRVGLLAVVNPESLDGVFGVVLGGGVDINPKHYGQETAGSDAPDDLRDVRELRIGRAALSGSIPVLAICRGMQMLNVVLGGSLVQHLGDSHRRKGIADAHEAAIEPGSRLAGILGSEIYSVNSRHHQAVDRLGEGLRITARCTADGIVEAIESSAHPFALGVQWHPEDRIATHGGDARLFEAFAGAIAQNRK